MFFSFLVGSGIGTGPGVIQDHYSPTMGRHRTNQHYNDHIVNGNGLHQPQFEAGTKPFTKSNQVGTASSFLFLHYGELSLLIQICVLSFTGAEFTSFQP